MNNLFQNLPALQPVITAKPASNGKKVGAKETARLSVQEFTAAVNAAVKLANRQAGVPQNLRQNQTWDEIEKTANWLITAPNVKALTANCPCWRLTTWAENESETATVKTTFARILPKDLATRQVFDAVFVTLTAEVKAPDHILLASGLE